MVPENVSVRGLLVCLTFSGKKGLHKVDCLYFGAVLWQRNSGSPQQCHSCRAAKVARWPALLLEMQGQQCCWTCGIKMPPPQKHCHQWCRLIAPHPASKCGLKNTTTTHWHQYHRLILFIFWKCGIKGNVAGSQKGYRLILFSFLGGRKATAETECNAMWQGARLPMLLDTWRCHQLHCHQHHSLVVSFFSMQCQSTTTTVTQPPLPQVDCFSFFCCGIEGSIAISPVPSGCMVSKSCHHKTLLPVDHFSFLWQNTTKK